MVLRYWLDQSPATVIKDVYRVNFTKDGMTEICCRGEGFQETIHIKRGEHYDFLTVAEE